MNLKCELSVPSFLFCTGMAINIDTTVERRGSRNDSRKFATVHYVTDPEYLSFKDG